VVDGHHRGGIALRRPGAPEVEHRHLLPWTALTAHARTLTPQTRGVLTAARHDHGHGQDPAHRTAARDAALEAALDACLPLATPHPPAGTPVQLDILHALHELVDVPALHDLHDLRDGRDLRP
jgi:hypothetical protein